MPTPPIFDALPELSDAAYNALDILVTARVAEKMAGEGGLAPSLFDQALLGPSITCSLRGMRVDHGRVPAAMASIQREASTAQEALLALVPAGLKFGKSWKPSPQALATILYQGFRVRTRLGKTDSPSVAKDILTEILEDPKTPEVAMPVVELALQLSRLEEDRKALEKPAGPDGRIHSSFMVSSAISGRWGSRKDAFGQGMNLHSASPFIRGIFIADPGYILVSMDQCQAESNCVAYLSGSEWYIKAHAAGNVHMEAAKIFFPEHADKSKTWIKETMHPSNPGTSYYQMSKKLQHACSPGDCEVLTRNGWIRMDAFSGQEEIAVWSSDFKISWEVPKAWHRYPYTGELAHLQGRNIDFQCTPEHRLPMFNNRTGFYEKLAGQMPLSYGKMPSCGLLEDSGEGPSGAEARLLAATWADGYLRQDGWTVFGLKKARKLERIQELLKSNDIAFSIWKRTGGGNQIACKQHLRKAIGWDLLGWSREAQAAFLDELPYWDGHRDPKQACVRVFNVHKDEMEVIATLCHLNGMMAKVVPHGKIRENQQQCWMLYMRKTYQQSIDLEFPHIAYVSIKTARIPYTGDVFCPTTSTGWFLTRRNGKTIVTGNSNYLQTPNGIARHAHIPVAEAKRVQGNYFRNMPEVTAYHRWVEDEIRSKRMLVSPLGRVRQFLGRTWEKTTVREAISWQPQSCISDITKIFLWRLWRRELDLGIQILLEHHDSVLFQVPEAKLHAVMTQIMPMTDIPIPIGPRVLNSRWEVKVGHDWEGMQEWTP